MTDFAIRLTDVTISYNRHPAVHHVSGSFRPGSLTAVAGPNGAGKSTLLKAVMGELPVSSGSIERAAPYTGRLGYLPQASELNRSFPMSVSDAVLMGAWHRTGAFRRITPEIAQDARAALSAVGLDGFASRPIGSLSAGQFQRVLFARLLLQDARIILLDEPFNAIDARTTADLLAIVRRWHQDGRTVIAVLHDFEQVKAHFPETLLLARDVISWGPTASTLVPGNLMRARAMAESWDEDAPLCADSARRSA